MERFKENLEVRKDQNIISLVLTLCFLIVFFSVVSSFSLDLKKNAENDSSTASNIAKKSEVK